MKTLPVDRLNGEAAPLRVLHCVAPGAFGGLESVVRALATGTLARQHDVHVAAVVEGRGDDHPYIRQLREDGVPVTGIEVAGRAYLKERRALAKVMADNSPDLVHTHGYRSDVLAGAMARRAHLPAITTVHGFTGGDWKNRLYERLQRRAFRKCDAVVAVSRPLEELLLRDGVRPERLHLVRNAIPAISGALSRTEARRELGVPAEGVRLGWIGRLGREKGIDIMIEALGRMGTAAPALSVIGSGPLRREMEERSAALGLGSTVHWHGTVIGAARLLRAFDLVVLSSRTEGTPIVALEAMQLGVPVVATAVGGVPDVIGDEEGWLVPGANAELLSASLREAVADDRERTLRGAGARSRYLRSFSPEPWLDRYHQIYRSMLSPTPGST